MKALIVKPYGFCSGVRRALRLLAEAKKRHKVVYTLGEIIHNRPVVEKLKKDGIIPIRRVKRNLDGVLAIRTHGVSPDHLKNIKKYGIRLLDTTCPYVRRVQEIAKMLAEESYKVVVVGDRNHPEVATIMGSIKGKGFLFPADASIGEANPSQLDSLRNKVGVVCQTTVARATLKYALSEIIKQDFLELRVFNTICSQVLLRQERFKALLSAADACVIVGGRESANTRRLYEIGRLSQKPSFWVEEKREALEVREALLGLGVCNVCFVSGTSTPGELFLSIVQNIKRRA